MGKQKVRIKGGKVGICKIMEKVEKEKRKKKKKRKENFFFLRVKCCIWACGRVSILEGLGLEVYLCLWLVGWCMECVMGSDRWLRCTRGCAILRRGGPV